MSNAYPKQFKVTTAVAGRNKFSMPFSCITTNNFGIMKPILCKYMVPGDKITNCEIREFQRLMPMPSPTFGKIDSITRAFFVPMRSIMHSFNEFVSFNPYYSGSYTSGTVKTNIQNYNVPFTTVQQLNNLFATSSYGLSTSVTSSAKPWDFACYRQATDTVIGYHKFTLTGKRVYDFLMSLGCNFPWLTAPYGSDGTANMRAQATQRISLLPIFACLKAYVDWIVPSRYYQNYADIIAMFRSNQPFTSALSATSLSSLLIPLRSYLESDFFTSAFANPFVEGSGTIGGTIKVPNPANSATEANSEFFKNVTAQLAKTVDDSGLQSIDAGGAYVNTSDSGTSTEIISRGINRFTLQSIGALQSMLDRGLIAGTKIQTWLETEFGVKPDNSYLDLSTYLGRFENTISIGDVTSHADTKGTGDTGSYLGQYAGKGIGTGNAHFDYETKDEHGFFIVFNEILPRTSYYQGLRPEFQMLDRFDFFEPRFDNLGMEAIPLRTLVNNQKNQEFSDTGFGELSNPDAIFGFCPRYAPLKMHQDVISGDFRIKSLNTGLDSWYLSRDFDMRNAMDEEYKFIGPAFCDGSGGTSTNSYDRIFQYTDNFADHFYQIFVFNLNMVRPMKQISDYMVDNDEDREPGQKVIGVNVHGNDNV